MLDATYPDGAYSIKISGGPTISFTVAFGQPVAPTEITNFTALQDWAGDTPTINWDPIAGASANDALSFLISASDGTELFDPTDLTGISTSVTSSALPEGETLTADLTYVRVVSRFDSLGTLPVLMGSGFNLEFPILVAVQGPAITTQPSNSAVSAGSLVGLSVTASGSSQAYQWYKDGVAIPGATGQNYIIPQSQASDGGNYTVVVSNAGGSTTSVPATVAVAPALMISTYAGTRQGGFGYADGAASTAQFLSPTGVAVDAAGNVYVADSGNNAVRMITPGGTVSTVAGAAGQPGSADGIGSAARFTTPWGIVCDGHGNLYVSDQAQSTIRKIAPGGVVTTLAGHAGQMGHADGVGAAAQFNLPQALALDAEGDIIVADTANYLLRRVTPGGTVTTIAGNPVFFDDYPVGYGNLGSVHAVAADAAGNIYVPGQSYQILMVSPSGEVSTVTGNGTAENQVGPNVGIPFPTALAVGPSGSLYVASLSGIFLVDQSRFVTSLGLIDSTGSYANTNLSVNDVSAIAVDAAGVLYLADTNNNVIRKCIFTPGNANPGITFTAQPQPATVALGDSVILNGAAGGEAWFYAWYKDGVPIPGATGTTLVLENTTAADAGNYTLLSGNTVGTLMSSPAAVNFVATGDPGRLLNLSVRSTEGTGAQTLITGFVLDGTTQGATESLLVRGVGPGLAQFGVSGVLNDPALTVFSGSQAIVSDDNWGGGATLAQDFASVGAFTLAPTSPDAALAYGFAPGPYTAQVTGNGGSTGIALAEVYDLSPAFEAGASQLVNLSARTQVGTGANILIAGFVIGGSTSKTVLIRAAGPALTQFGVSGVRESPQLKVFSGNTVVAANTGWDYSNSVIRDLFFDVGAFVFNIGSSDSAVALTLAPGAYTAQVSGVGGTTGVALVEIYVVP